MPTGHKEAVKRFVQHPGTTTRPRKEGSWEGEGMGKGQLKRAGLLFFVRTTTETGMATEIVRTSWISLHTTTYLSFGTASLEGCRE
jgi:hypothetical protein